MHKYFDLQDKPGRKKRARPEDEERKAELVEEIERKEKDARYADELIKRQDEKRREQPVRGKIQGSTAITKVRQCASTQRLEHRNGLRIFLCPCRSTTETILPASRLYWRGLRDRSCQDRKPYLWTKMMRLTRMRNKIDYVMLEA